MQNISEYLRNSPHIYHEAWFLRAAIDLMDFHHNRRPHMPSLFAASFCGAPACSSFLYIWVSLVYDFAVAFCAPGSVGFANIRSALALLDLYVPRLSYLSTCY